MDGTAKEPITIQGSGDVSEIKLRGSDTNDYRVLHIRHDHYIIEVFSHMQATTLDVVCQNGGALIRCDQIGQWVPVSKLANDSEKAK